MPLIEELPVTSTIKASHGWAYVPDTGPIAAQQPGSRDRKRVAAATSRNAAAASAKHQKGIQQRLDSLNKENYKDGVTVPIPARSGAGANAREKSGKKMTGNVRRILTYQRGFAHYLADEEANNPGGKSYLLPNLPSGMGPPPVPTPVTAVVATGAERKVQKTTTGKDEGRRKSGTSRTRSATNEMAAPATPTPVSQSRGKKRGRAGSRAQSAVEEQSTPVSTPTPTESQQPVKSEDTDTPMTDADLDTDTLPSTDQQALPTSTSTAEPQPPYPPLWDNDPLLTTTPSEVPRLPSEKVMQQLLSEPALTYNAVRATPLDLDQQRPPRHFCGVCGYWGRVKCKKCGEWTCGIMECWRGHEGVCVMAGVY